MPFPAPTYNVETEEHVETTTVIPDVKFDDKLKDDILSQIHEENPLSFIAYTMLKLTEVSEFGTLHF